MDRQHRSKRHMGDIERHRLSDHDRKDIYARITDEIVAAIEAGPGRWQMPWHHDGSAVARPINLVSRKRYRGINVLALWVAAMKAGYDTGLWGTYRQFAEAGGQVRKGERSTTVVFWKEFRRDASSEPDDNDEDDGRRARFMARGYAVFNAAQVDGLDMTKPPELPETDRVASAEAFFDRLGIVIRTEGDQACYRPREDAVLMPPFARFRAADAFYQTLSHECAHATGARHRLDRKLETRFGSEAYAAEELIAELAASFLMADLGFACGARPESAAYLASWLKVLKADNRAIFTAAAKAQAAADWMHERQPEKGSVGVAFADDGGTSDDAVAEDVVPMRAPIATAA
jgi:antirestriction protein ArdC